MRKNEANIPTYIFDIYIFDFSLSSKYQGISIHSPVRFFLKYTRGKSQILNNAFKIAQSHLKMLIRKLQKSENFIHTGYSAITSRLPLEIILSTRVLRPNPPRQVIYYPAPPDVSTCRLARPSSLDINPHPSRQTWALPTAYQLPSPPKLITECQAIMPLIKPSVKLE